MDSYIYFAVGAREAAMSISAVVDLAQFKPRGGVLGTAVLLLPHVPIPSIQKHTHTLKCVKDPVSLLHVRKQKQPRWL